MDAEYVKKCVRSQVNYWMEDLSNIAGWHELCKLLSYITNSIIEPHVYDLTYH